MLTHQLKRCKRLATTVFFAMIVATIAPTIANAQAAQNNVATQHNLTDPLIRLDEQAARFFSVLSQHLEVTRDTSCQLFALCSAVKHGLRIMSLHDCIDAVVAAQSITNNQNLQKLTDAMFEDLFTLGAGMKQSEDGRWHYTPHQTRNLQLLNFCDAQIVKLNVDTVCALNSNIIEVKDILCVENTVGVSTNKLAPKDGSVITVDGTFNLTGGNQYLVNGSPISGGGGGGATSFVGFTADADLDMNNFDIHSVNGLCVDASLSVDTINAKRQTIISLLDDLAVSGSIQTTGRISSNKEINALTDVNAGKNVCVGNTLLTDLIDAKDQTIITLGDDLAVSGSIQTTGRISSNKEINALTDVNAGKNVCVGDTLLTDLIDAKDQTVITLGDDLAVTGSIQATTTINAAGNITTELDVIVCGTAQSDAISAKENGIIMVLDDLCIDENKTLSVNRIAPKTGTILTIDAEQVNLIGGAPQYLINGLPFGGGGSSFVGFIANDDLNMGCRGIDNVGTMSIDKLFAKDMGGAIQVCDSLCLDETHTLSVNKIAPKTGNTIFITGAPGMGSPEVLWQEADETPCVGLGTLFGVNALALFNPDNAILPSAFITANTSSQEGALLLSNRNDNAMYRVQGSSATDVQHELRSDGSSRHVIDVSSTGCVVRARHLSGTETITMKSNDADGGSIAVRDSAGGRNIDISSIRGVCIDPALTLSVNRICAKDSSDAVQFCTSVCIDENKTLSVNLIAPKAGNILTIDAEQVNLIGSSPQYLVNGIPLGGGATSFVGFTADADLDMNNFDIHSVSGVCIDNTLSVNTIHPKTGNILRIAPNSPGAATIRLGDQANNAAVVTLGQTSGEGSRIEIFPRVLAIEPNIPRVFIQTSGGSAHGRIFIRRFDGKEGIKLMGGPDANAAAKVEIFDTLENEAIELDGDKGICLASELTLSTNRICAKDSSDAVQFCTSVCIDENKTLSVNLIAPKAGNILTIDAEQVDLIGSSPQYLINGLPFGGGGSSFVGFIADDDLNMGCRGIDNVGTMSVDKLFAKDMGGAIQVCDSLCLDETHTLSVQRLQPKDPGVPLSIFEAPMMLSAKVAILDAGGALPGAISIASIGSAAPGRAALLEVGMGSDSGAVNVGLGASAGGTVLVGAPGGGTAISLLGPTGDICLTGTLRTDAIKCKENEFIDIGSSICLDAGLTLSTNRIAAKTSDIISFANSKLIEIDTISPSAVNTGRVEANISISTPKLFYKPFPNQAITICNSICLEDGLTLSVNRICAKDSSDAVQFCTSVCIDENKTLSVDNISSKGDTLSIGTDSDSNVLSIGFSGKSTTVGIGEKSKTGFGHDAPVLHIGRDAESTNGKSTIEVAKSATNGGLIEVYPGSSSSTPSIILDGEMGDICLTGTLSTDAIDCKDNGFIDIRCDLCIDENKTLSVNLIAPKAGNILTIDAEQVDLIGSSPQYLVNGSPIGGGGSTSFVGFAADADLDMNGREIFGVNGLCVDGTLSVDKIFAKDDVDNVIQVGSSMCFDVNQTLSVDTISSKGDTLNVDRNPSPIGVWTAEIGRLQSGSGNNLIQIGSAASATTLSNDIRIGNNSNTTVVRIGLGGGNSSLSIGEQTIASGTSPRVEIGKFSLDADAKSILEIARQATRGGLIEVYPGSSSSTPSIILDGEMGDICLTGTLSTDAIDCKDNGFIDIRCDLCIDENFALSVNRIEPCSGTDITITATVDILGDLFLDGTLFGSSDRRVKTKIEAIDPLESMGRIAQLQPRRYKIIPEFSGQTLEEQIFQRGFIAQEVQDVLPEVVGSRAYHIVGGKRLENFLSLDYARVVVDLVGALHNANDRITQLEADKQRSLEQRDDFKAFVTDQIAQLHAQIAELQG